MNRRPTQAEIKAIKTKYKKGNHGVFGQHEFMVKNLAKYNLLNERMNAKDIAFSHKKNFGGVGKVEAGLNPRFMGHYNKKGIRDDELATKNFHNRSASRYGQGGYGDAVPKGDRRSGRQEYDNNKSRYRNYM